MDKTYIDQLLELYWEGESSLEQEKEIKSYFGSEKIHEEHQVYSGLFQLYKNQAKIKYVKPQKEEVKTSRFSRVKIIGVAASILLLFFAGSVFFKYGNLNKSSQEYWVKYEVEDPEEARKMAEEAIVFLSSKLNKGESNIKKNFKVLKKMPIH